MPISRLIAVVVAVAIVYTLQFVVGWPWYAAIASALVAYVLVRYIGETVMKTQGPKA
jgi:uncharacterized membrane protein YdjX (TVP38/TMEM64 family)